jgi:hypothetical protein
MMISTIENYPLHWPVHVKRTEKPQRARFGSKDKNRGWGIKQLSVAEAIKRLLEEISKMTKVGQTYRVPPDSIIISTNIPTRNDGLPYSNSKEPQDSGVAVYFDLDGEPHCLPCDRWDRVADNMAAIASHINAMRGIERWGVADLKTAFTGFKALPQNAGQSNKPWWKILELNKDASREEISAAYRKLAKKYHPDLHGGDEEKFIQIKAAMEEAVSQFK